MKPVSFYKFVKHEVSTTQDQAKEYASRIASGEVKPKNSQSQWYRLGGYAYKLKTKAYIVDTEHLGIIRGYAYSVKELRESLCLSRKDKVALCPFNK
jgi:hypothetical protein